ncbi:hypothetical protein NKG94_16540 [Micromonospora sp. M12]
MRAVDQACALGLDDLAYDLAGCLERYFDIRGMYVEWSDINTQVLKLCETTGNLRGQAAMLRGLIEVRTWANPGQDGDAMAAMRVDATHLLDLFAAVDEDRGVADALVLCSWAFTARVTTSRPERRRTAPCTWRTRRGISVVRHALSSRWPSPKRIPASWRLPSPPSTRPWAPAATSEIPDTRPQCSSSSA